VNTSANYQTVFLLLSSKICQVKVVTLCSSEVNSPAMNYLKFQIEVIVINQLDFQGVCTP